MSRPTLAPAATRVIGTAYRSPGTRRLFLLGLSAIGYALCLDLLIGHGIYGHGGGEGGGDVFAYWTAGRNLAAREPVYGAPIGGYAAYLYPPPIAQLFSLVAPLPLGVVAWGWRLVEWAALAVAVGGVRNAGIAMLLWPPVIAELDAANVHLLIAAAVALAIRGDARFVLPVALSKFATLAAVPLALRIAPRRLAVGGLLAAAIVGVSFALSPGLWLDWARFSLVVSDQSAGWYNLGTSIPLEARLAAAFLAALLALRWRRVAAVAATLALPVLWLHGLSVLVAAVTPSAPGRRRG